MLILSDTIRKIEILFYKEESIMRGVETRIQEIRHKIFTEVARMAYHTEWPVKERMEALPYKIIPGEKGNFRNDVFLERAIVGERLRLAMGLPSAVLQSIHLYQMESRLPTKMKPTIHRLLSML